MTEMTLAQLKTKLQEEVKWNENLQPAPVTPGDISPFHATGRQAGGWLGEEGLARIADRRGEIVLDVGRGVDDVNKGGPDLVTLAERENGEKYLKFYDNKANKASSNVAAVSALETTFENNRKLYLDDWQDRMQYATPVQQDLLKQAGDLLKAGKYERLVTNWAGNLEGVTERLQNDGIRFEDVRLPESPSRAAASMSGGTDAETAAQLPASPLQAAALQSQAEQPLESATSGLSQFAARLTPRR